MRDSQFCIITPEEVAGLCALTPYELFKAGARPTPPQALIVDPEQDDQEEEGAADEVLDPNVLFREEGPGPEEGDDLRAEEDIQGPTYQPDQVEVESVAQRKFFVTILSRATFSSF